MAKGKVPGPLCQHQLPLKVQDGTLNLQPSTGAAPIGLYASSLSLQPLTMAAPPNMHALSVTPIGGMMSAEELGTAIQQARKYLSPEIADKLQVLLSPEAIAFIVANIKISRKSEVWTKAKDLTDFVTALDATDLDLAGQHFARFVNRIGADDAIACLLRDAFRFNEAQWHRYDLNYIRSKVPEEPGIYTLSCPEGNVIYAGKATSSVRERLATYGPGSHNKWIRLYYRGQKLAWDTGQQPNDLYFAYWLTNNPALWEAIAIQNSKLASAGLNEKNEWKPLIDVKDESYRAIARNILSRLEGEERQRFQEWLHRHGGPAI